MNSEASDFHPNIVEEIRGGTWYEPWDRVGQDRPISTVLLSVYGAVLFAAVTFAPRGNAVLMSVFVAMLFAAITIALVGIVVGGQPCIPS